VPATPISDELRDSAAEFPQSALRAYLNQDHAVFLLHAATALEHTSKAFLASIHGSLIAASDFDSLLHLCGRSSHTRTPRTRMKTITVQESLTRAGQLVPALENLKKSLQLLVWVRNGVVHAGQVERDVDILIPFLRACDYLLAELPDSDRSAFWGASLEIVDARLSESTDAAKVRAVDPLAAARRRFAERYAGMEDTVREAVIASIEESYVPEKYQQTLLTCPACKNLALAHGSYDVEWEPDWDYSDGQVWMAGAVATVRFAPGTVECRVCDLVLDGEAELQAAGVPGSWELDNADVDPSDFYERESEWE
jgi:hypothetical protein